MNVSKKQELKNYVVNSIVHNAFDPNELLRLINLLPDQPQLNENQQVVLDWLKNRYTGNADPFGVAACLFSQTPRSEVIVATLKLTKDEQAQVLKIFANWTLEQVEDL